MIYSFFSFEYLLKEVYILWIYFFISWNMVHILYNLNLRESLYFFHLIQCCSKTTKDHIMTTENAKKMLIL